MLNNRAFEAVPLAPAYRSKIGKVTFQVSSFIWKSIPTTDWGQKVQMAAFGGQQGRNSRPVRVIIGGQQAA